MNLRISRPILSLNRCSSSLFPTYSLRFINSHKPNDEPIVRFRANLFKHAPPEITEEIRNYGWFLRRFEVILHRIYPKVMNDPTHHTKKAFDTVFLLMRGWSRMQPFRRKTFFKDLLNVLKLLGCLALFPALNYFMFGHKDPDPVNSGMDEKVLKAELLDSWKRIHKRRGVDPAPPCPWISDLSEEREPPKDIDWLSNLRAKYASLDPYYYRRTYSFGATGNNWNPDDLVWTRPEVLCIFKTLGHPTGYSPRAVEAAKFNLQFPLVWMLDPIHLIADWWRKDGFKNNKLDGLDIEELAIEIEHYQKDKGLDS